MKRFTYGGIIALCCLLGLGIFNPVAALDTSSQDLSLKYSSELKPISNSFQIAKSTFLPEYGESSFSGYKTLDDDYNFKNCEDYPHSSCPTGARCESCPFNVKKYKVVACTDPYLKSEGTCVCPTATPVIYPNDVCTKYCGSTCIAKTCTPTANKTTCTNDFRNCDNGCGQNTRKCCNPCTHKITSKPENSSYTYCDCTDDDGAKKIQCGCVCNSGYHLKNGTCENGGSCEKDCIANNCSGYPLSSCPANANCSKCTITATNCSTDGTKYKIDSCNDGYTLSGNVCRALTCEEKGQKTCNGSCIATSECCGGCPSGKRCSNGSCVADKYYVNIAVSLNGSTGQNYNIGLRDDGCPVDKKPLQGISIISGPNAGKNISLYPKCRSIGGSTNFKEDVFCTQTTCNFSFEVSPGDTISVSTYGDLFFACGYPDVTDNLGNPIYAAEDKILTPIGTTYYYFDFNCIH